MTFVNFPPSLNDGECILVTGDVKQNENNPPNFNCVPVAADQVADDYVAICKRKGQEGEDIVTWHFKSEVPGLFGGGDPFAAKIGEFGEVEPLRPYVPALQLLGKLISPETFSRYVFQLNANNQLSVIEGGKLYKVDDLDRALLLGASAFACAGDALDDDALRSFGETLYANRADFTTTGDRLPLKDWIRVLYGPYYISKPRDFAFTGSGPRNPYPNVDYPHVRPAVQEVATDTTGQVPEFPFVQPSVVPVDVKENDFFMANVNYAPIAADVVTNDKARVWSEEVDGSICVRFSSEVGGPLGGTDTAGEKFSRYDMCVTKKNELAVKDVASGQVYETDAPERAMLLISSAIAAMGFMRHDKSLVKFGRDLYAARKIFVPTGSELPQMDRLANQVKTSGFVDIHAQLSEDVDYNCRQNFSLFRCIGASMQGM